MRGGLILVALVTPGRSGLLRTQAGAEDRGEADALLESGVLRVDEVGEEEQVLGAGDAVTLATLRDLLLGHPQQVTHRGAFFRLKS